QLVGLGGADVVIQEETVQPDLRACVRRRHFRDRPYVTVVRLELAVAGRERRGEIGPRGDPELRKHAVEVRADRAMREVQPLADLSVRQPLCGELRDLQLLRGQLIACLGYPAPAPLTRGAQLGACLVSPAGC